MFRTPPLPESSPVQAFFCAPLVTPVLAIPLAGALPGIYTNQFDMVVALPFVIFLSLFYGYLGMLFVCLPILAVLKIARRLEGIRLSVYTSLLGGAAWTWIVAFPESTTGWPLANVFVVGTVCSLGVSAFFCVLGDIPMKAKPALGTENTA